MSADDFKTDAETLVRHIKKCATDEEVIELLAAKMSVVHTAGKIAGGESLARRLGLAASVGHESN